MNHNDESYSTMLLTSDIRPDREELAEPLSTVEWHALNKRLRERGMRMSDLVDMDMSALIMRLEITEQEALRLHILLGRMLPLSMALEKFAMRGIDVVTYSQAQYPASLRASLGDDAPPLLYLSGRHEIFKQDAIAILGAVPPRGDVEAQISLLVRLAVEAGYTIVTDATTGLCDIARREAVANSGRFVEVLSGDMTRRADECDITAAIARGEGALVGIAHPDKPIALESALERNRVIYALVQAAFVFGVEKNSGATWTGANDALKKRWCPRLYAWDSPAYADNALLIQRGWTPFTAVTCDLFNAMRAQWISDASKQLCMFDNEQPL